MWDKLIGQDHAKDFLQTAIKDDRISHAYIFWGSDSIGKRLTASLFSAAINCEDGGCGSCKSCSTIFNELPPLYSINPIGRQITISQINEAKHFLELKPGDDHSRQILIIDDIDLMNSKAANALLKTLEEPPGKSCIIGITSRPQNLLPTIKSRCQLIPFSILDEQSEREILKRFSEDDKLIDIVVKLFPGQIGKPLFWLQNNEMFQWRNDIISATKALATGRETNPLAAVENLFKPLKSRIDLIGKNFKDKEQQISDFVGKKKYASSMLKKIEEDSKRTKDKESANFLVELLNVMTSFYRDALLSLDDKNGDKISNIDIIDEIEAVAKTSDADKITTALKKISEVYKVLGYNLDEKSILENLFMNLWEVHNIAYSG